MDPGQALTQNAGQSGGSCPDQQPVSQNPGTGPSGVSLQWKNEKTDKDVKDSHNLVPVSPSEPPLQKMDLVDGYDNVGFSGGFLPPPSYDEAMRQEKPERQVFTGLPKIQEDEAKEALLLFVAEHCCYGKGAAKQLSIRDLQHISAFHYTLESFGEGRSTSWAHDPYKDQTIDGPENGPAPLPWQIQVQPITMFKDQKTDVEVPHTASIKPCHTCSATGLTTCDRCFGSGQVMCSYCSGLGYKTAMEGDEGQKSCSFCYGSGNQSCQRCLGIGTVTCGSCNSRRYLKWYIKLTVVWKNHVKDHIIDQTDMPVNLIKKASGQVAFEEEQPRVWPVNHFPDPEVNKTSQRLIVEQSTEYSSERVLKQRQTVRVIPVTKVLYKWKGKDLDYIVYGFEKKVYAPSYPQQCCCGCILL